MRTRGAGTLNFYDWDNSHIPDILQEVFMQRIYHPFVIGKKDAIFLDIGFNIGLWSFYASNYAKHIYGFEPSKQSYELGLKNMKDNGIDNVTVFNKAIAPTDGTATLNISGNSTMNSLKPEVNDTHKTETVATIRLDTFVKEQGIKKIDFAKIDIEGSEAELFASESFKNVVPILDAFVYEWHTWCTSNPRILNQGLMDYGYKMRQLSTNATVFVCFK